MRAFLLLVLLMPLSLAAAANPAGPEQVSGWNAPACDVPRTSGGRPEPCTCTATADALAPDARPAMRARIASRPTYFVRHITRYGDGIDLEFSAPIDAAERIRPEQISVASGGKSGPPAGVSLDATRTHLYVASDGAGAPSRFALRFLVAPVAEERRALRGTTVYCDTPIDAVRAAPPLPGGGASAAPLNTLSSTDVSTGWRLLFDGSTLAGWRRRGGGEIDPTWHVVDGIITVRDWDERAKRETVGDLATDEGYANFDLRLDWRITPNGNSGVFYFLGAEDVERGLGPTGPEYQLLDDAFTEEGTIATHRAGDVYDLIAAAARVTLPAGGWNTTRIVVRSGVVEHWLNGRLIVVYRLGSPLWRQRVAVSKFRDAKQFARGPTGRIALQDHGDVVSFRDLRIHVLP